MSAESFLTSSAEVGIGIAGFAGIAVVLGHRGQGTWTRQDIDRMRLLLRASFAAVLLSLLPLALFSTTLSERILWTVASSIYTVFVIAATFTDIREIRRAIADSIERPKRASTYFVAISSISISLNLVNVAFLQTAWPYLFALLGSLTFAFIQFVRILHSLWQSPALNGRTHR